MVFIICVLETVAGLLCGIFATLITNILPQFDGEVMRLIFILMLSIALIILNNSCDDDTVLSSDQFESEITETQVITLSTQTNFIVENTNGIINITASDTANNIYCQIRKMVKSKTSVSDAQSHLSSITVTITKNNSIAKIKVDNPDNDGRDYDTKLEIILPNNFDHDLSLGNGTISINSSAKRLIIGLGNGIVNADVVLVDTCFASILLGNGDVNLTIPGNTNASLNASIGNGLITNNGLNFQNQQITSKQFNGTLGNGAGNITLSVGNGNISMNKK